MAPHDIRNVEETWRAAVVKAQQGQIELIAALAVAGRMRALHGSKGQPIRVWSDALVGGPITAGPVRLATCAGPNPKYIQVSLDPSLATGLAATGKVSFHTAGSTGQSGVYHDLLAGEGRFECILLPRESLWCLGRWGNLVPVSINVFVMEVEP